eukprot:UN30021
MNANIPQQPPPPQQQPPRAPPNNIPQNNQIQNYHNSQTNNNVITNASHQQPQQSQPLTKVITTSTNNNNMINSNNNSTNSISNQNNNNNNKSMTEEESESECNFSWVNYFLSKKGHQFFCEIDQNYLQDTFNFYGINTQVHYIDQALDIICDVEDDQDFNEQHQELVEHDADTLYGLIHARFIITTRGLQQMYQKYNDGEFGQCYNVACNNQKVVPAGMYDAKNKAAVKVFCPSCDLLYDPPSDDFDNIDGAYWGT